MIVQHPQGAIAPHSRTVRRAHLVLASLILALLAGLTPPVTRAETIEVGCTVAALRSAVSRAAAGAELVLAPRCVYRFETPDTASGAALPRIARPLTIRGQGATIRRADAASFRLIWAQADLTLTDLTLEAGAVALPEPAGLGAGGAVLAEGPLALDGVTVRGNTASYGGGVTALGGLEIVNSTFVGNTSTLGGGAIFLASPSSTGIADTFFASNSAGTSGGAIMGNEAAPLYLKRATFEGNRADGSGGAIFARGTLAISDSELRRNMAKGTGGAVAAEQTLTIERSVLRHNLSNGYGHAVYLVQRGGGASRIESSLFLDNRNADDSGSVLCLLCISGGSGSVEVRSNTLVNSRHSAGLVAVALQYGDAEVRNNIITRFRRGVQRADGAPSVTLRTRNNLYAENTENEFGPVTSSAGHLTPARGAGFVDEGRADYQLAPGSPAVDAGDAGGAPLDLLGTYRPQAGRQDIGAYEFDAGEVPAAQVLAVPCPAGRGDTAALVAAVQRANFVPGRNRISIPDGCSYTFAEPAEGQNALPVVRDALEIVGQGVSLRRDAAAQPFRLVTADMAPLTLRGVTLAGGVAGDGGAIYAAMHDRGDLHLLLDNVTVRDNISEGDGSVTARHGRLTIRGGVFEENRTSGVNSPVDGASGGAISLYDTDLSVHGVRFLRNVMLRGATISNVHGPVTILASHFVENVGSVLAINRSELLAVNNLFVGNLPSPSQPAPAIVLVGEGRDTGALLAHNTLVVAPGAAQAALLATNIRAEVINNIVVGYAGGFQARDGGVVVARRNLFHQAAPSGERAISADPRFRDAAAGEFRLAAGSPAIDAGEVVPNVSGDLAGGPRERGAAPDLGAFEADPTAAAPAVFRIFLPLLAR
jgi:predicted outer membrane repeat protein